MDYRIYDKEMGFCTLSEWCKKNKIDFFWAVEKRKEKWSLQEIKLGEKLHDYAVRNWGIK